VIRLFVFDLDGTLVDSLRDLADSANALLAACGAHPLGEAAIGAMVGDGAATLVARAFSSAGVRPPADALDRFLAVYDTRLLNHTRPYDGIPEALAALGARASLALLTNKPGGATRRILAGVDLVRFFDQDAVVGGDGPFPRKPDPAGLLHLCARAGVGTDEAMMVGDSVIDWRTARNARTRICLARYGFGFRGFPQAELTAGETVIDAPPDLLQL
jgi:phosphoglycolate phosphatase